MLPKYKCKRCGYIWIPRTDNPVVCPKCKNPYWNREKRGEENERNNNRGKTETHF